MRRAAPGLALALAIVAASASAQGPASRAVMLGPVDSALARVVRGLTSAGFTVARAEREPGLVTTEELVVGNTEFKDHGFGYWVDCGRQGVISRAAGASELRLRVTALLTAVGADSTAVELRLQSAAVGNFDHADQRVTCTSRGRLEPLLLAGMIGL